MTSTVLKTCDLLSNIECIEIVREYLKLKNLNGINFNLIDYEVTSASEDIYGFLGEYFKLKINVQIKNVEQQKTYYFFIKSMPVRNPLQRKVAEEIGVYKKEIFLYTTLFKDMKNHSIFNWHPNCYYSRSDLLVFEDLIMSGYQHMNISDKETFSLDHIKVVLKSIAALHSNSMTYEALEKNNIGEKFEEYLKETLITKENNWYRAGLLAIKTIGKIHPKFRNSEKFISNEFDRILEQIYELSKTSKIFRNVFSHRDLWDKNILFKYDKLKPIKSILIDFQLCRYHPPAIDVLMFIYLNTRPEFRDNIYEECLLYYYQCLKEFLNGMHLNINDNITWNEFRESCDYFKLIPLTMNAIYTPLLRLPKEYFLELQRKHPEKYHQYMEVNRDELILNLFEKNLIYKNYVMETIEELLSYIIGK